MKYLSNLLLVAMMVGSLFSCNKGSGLDEDQGQDTLPPVPADSVFVVERIQQPYNGGIRFNYDVQKRVSSFGRFSNNLNWDSTIIFYGSDGKVAAMCLFRPDFLYEHKVQPTVIIYQAGKPVKFIHNRSKTKNEYVASYLTTPGIGVDLESYDTLIYNNSNKLIEVRNYGFPIAGTYPSVLFSSLKINYKSGADSLYENVEYFIDNGAGVLQLQWKFSFYQYEQTRNPFYQMIPYYGILASRGFVSALWIVPHYFSKSGDYLMADMPLNSNQNTVSMNIHYNFTGTLLTSLVVGGATDETVNFIYKKLPK